MVDKMANEVTIKIDLAKYKYVDLDVESALKLLDKIVELLNKKTNDVSEVVRYIRNFDDFYEYMRKKFKDYIAPPRKPDDFIKGNVVIDKVKLYKEGDEKRVVLVFDRRVDTALLEKALREIGFENVGIEKSF